MNQFFPPNSMPTKVRLGWLLTAVIFTGCWFLRRHQLPFDLVGPALKSELLLSASRWIALGTSPTAFIVAALLAAFLAVETQHVHGWLHIGVSITGAVVISWLLKEVLEIPRPADAVRQLSSYSFPSTHATAAATLGYLTLFHWQRIYGNPKKVLVTVVVSSTLAIAASRVVLGVHSISDVVAGLLLGLSWGVIMAMWWQGFNQFLCRYNKVQPPNFTV